MCNLVTFKFIVVERPILLNTILNTMWLDAVRSTGLVLKYHTDGVLFFSSDHWTYWCALE